MPKFKDAGVKVDWLATFYNANPEAYLVTSDVESFNKEVEESLIPFAVEECTEVFPDKVEIKGFETSKPTELKDIDPLYSEGNFLLVQALDVTIGKDRRVIPLALFTNVDDYKERFLDVVAEYFD